MSTWGPQHDRGLDRWIRELDRWIMGGGDGGWIDARICRCGDQHGEEHEYDQCRQLADHECQCCECDALITNEQALEHDWECEECLKEAAK